MTKEIIVREGDRVVYQGAERRSEFRIPSVDTKFPFGLSMKDVIWFGFIIVTCTIFLLRTDARISANEKVLATVVATNTKIAEFMEDSDSWHTQVTGIRFKGGAPITNLRTDMSRKLFEGSTKNLGYVNEKEGGE